MADDAADIEQKWQASDFSARMPGQAKKGDKVYDPYSAENNSNVAEKLNQKSGQFKAAPRRGLLSIIAGKLGF